MSLSRPTTQNPAVRFYQWSGSRGALEWYDKENQTNVPVKLPFKFIVLDELSTITGYSDADQSGFWSNEVRKVSEDLTVRTKRGVKYVGTYKNKDGMVQMPQGAKYAKSVYIAHKIADEWVIGNLKLSGVALTSWIELGSKHKTEGNITALTGSTEGSKGATTFQIPTFEYGGAPEGDTLDIAVDLDAKLQNYLDTYLTAPKFDDNAEPVSDDINQDVGYASEEQVAEFNQKKETKRDWNKVGQGTAPVTTEPLPEYTGEEPIDLNDIPF